MSRLNSIGERLTAIMEVEPAARAVEFKGRWYSWGELRAAMDALDALLNEVGLGSGARVAVVLRNRPENVAAIALVVASGRCLVTLNPVLPDDRLAADIEQVEAPVVVAAEQDWLRPGVQDAARRSGAECVQFGVAADGLLRFERRMAGQRASRSRALAPGIAIEMLTSGTTGPAKRIALAQRNFAVGLEGWGSFEKGRDQAPRLRSGTQIHQAPFAHISGVQGILNVLLAGRKVVLLERFNVTEWHDALVRHRPKVASAPPAALRMILDAGYPKQDMASLAIFRTGSAPLDPQLADDFHRRYGVPVLQNYGATEYAGGVAGWTLQDFERHYPAKRGSVGRLNDGVQARVVDPDTGRPLANDQPGVLELKARQLGDGDSWLRTSDLAKLDGDGFLWLTGRADNSINRGGYKIAPDDVVRALESHPAVSEAAVVGLPDARLGQVPVAGMKLKPDAAKPDEAELDQFLRRRLLPYQIPVRVIYVDEFPRTVSLKVDQAAFRQLFESGSR